MNKKIQIRRNKPSGTHYRVLYAKTGRKRRLHAATTAAANRHAGMGVDVPGIGVGRALFVILILHVLAIASIYIHSAFFGDADHGTADLGQNTLQEQAAAVVTPVASAPEKLAVKKKKSRVAPVIPELANTGRYIVETGDTYPRIAENRNVAEGALRALNNNRPLRAGVVLDLPAELSARPVNPAPKAATVKKSESQHAVASKPERVERAAPKPAVAKAQKTAKAVKPVAAKPAETKKRQVADDVANAPKAILIEEEAVQPIGVEDSGKVYTIVPGDTLTRIAKRFNVSQKNLLALNGIKDPNKLYAGRGIKIPTH